MPQDSPNTETSNHEASNPGANDYIPKVYTELRRLASHRLAHEKPGQTLQATALVHEAWLRLAQSRHQALATHVKSSTTSLH